MSSASKDWRIGSLRMIGANDVEIFTVSDEDTTRLSPFFACRSFWNRMRMATVITRMTKTTPPAAPTTTTRIRKNPDSDLSFEGGAGFIAAVAT